MCLYALHMQHINADGDDTELQIKQNSNKITTTTPIGIQARHRAQNYRVVFNSGTIAKIKWAKSEWEIRHRRAHTCGMAMKSSDLNTQPIRFVINFVFQFVGFLFCSFRSFVHSIRVFLPKNINPINSSTLCIIIKSDCIKENYSTCMHFSIIWVC